MLLRTAHGARLRPEHGPSRNSFLGLISYRMGRAQATELRHWYRRFRLEL